MEIFLLWSSVYTSSSGVGVVVQGGDHGEMMSVIETAGGGNRRRKESYERSE